MNTNKLIVEEPWLYVDITSPTKEQTESGEIGSKNSSNAPRIFQKAKILHTFDNDKYPVDSEWMIGDTPPMIVNYFGTTYQLIQRKNLYARLQ